MSGKKTEMVYQWLLAYIDEHKFSSNLKVPSENVIRQRLHVGRETVRSALKLLQDEGLIDRQRGSGTYIRKGPALARETESGQGLCRIGLILQGQDSEANTRLMEGISDGLKKNCSERKTDLNVFLTDNKFANERRCLQTVIGQDFQGFIVDGAKASLINPNRDCYQAIYDRQIPIIFYNNYYKDLPCPKVVVDDARCADELVRLLVQSGHQKIAGVFVYDEDQSLEKFHGTVTALRKYQVEFEDEYVKWCVSEELQDEHFVKALDRFVRGLPQCTAIICSNYTIYRMVCTALKQRGKRIPEDYSVVCFDYSGKTWEEEGITCSLSQGYRTGLCLAENLLKMIDRHECSGARYSCILEPRIYVGNSIRTL
jgi:GntR family transcriptional regulator of arabinose operon